jgi:hypothetical protein
LLEQTRVVELIDPTTKSWNLPLLKAVFQEDEAKIIYTIHLSPLQPNDQLIWRSTKNGMFTVRSAYYLAVEKQGQSRRESSGTSYMEKLWKMIWSLAVHNSVKMFLWKACNNILPTKDNLFKRKVVDHTTCPICERDEKTVDGNQGTALKDLVQVPIGPVTRARAKKFKDVLNGLIQEL